MSNVAHIRRQIEEECEAMRLAMSGFRITGSHDMINCQFDQLEIYYERLEELIGEEAAMDVMIDTLDTSLEQKVQNTHTMLPSE